MAKKATKTIKVTKTKKKTEDFDLDFSIEEDALLRGLIDSKGRKVEIIAFGIVYAGVLERVDLDGGQIVIADGEDKAMIEIERIESLTPLENYL